jgi:hypothetical protein
MEINSTVKKLNCVGLQEIMKKVTPSLPSVTHIQKSTQNSSYTVWNTLVSAHPWPWKAKKERGRDGETRLWSTYILGLLK